MLYTYIALPPGVRRVGERGIETRKTCQFAYITSPIPGPSGIKAAFGSTAKRRESALRFKLVRHPVISANIIKARNKRSLARPGAVGGSVPTPLRRRRKRGALNLICLLLSSSKLDRFYRRSILVVLLLMSVSPRFLLENILCFANNAL